MDLGDQKLDALLNFLSWTFHSMGNVPEAETGEQ